MAYTIDHVEILPMPESSVVGVDIETSRSYGKDSDPHRDSVLSIQVSDGYRAWITTSMDHMASIVPILESPHITKIIHNANFDLQFLMHQFGAKPDKRTIWDSLVVERVLNMGRDVSNGLDDVASRRLGVTLNKEVRETFSHHTGPFTEEQIRYSVEDVVYLPRIMELQQEDVSRMQLGRVVALENRIVPAVARMSLSGVRFDNDLWQEYIPQIRDMLTSLEKEISDYAGLSEQFTLFGDSRILLNLNSSDQVINLLSSKGIVLKKKDKLTSDRKVMAEFLADHPNHKHADLLRTIIEWRQWSHTLSTNYLKYVNPATGLIHSIWNQLRADTGRFGSSRPNLQNVERPVEGKPNLRRMFLPPPGFAYIDEDYRQQEPRIFAQISGDENMRQACQELDVYPAFGARMSTNPTRHKVKTGFLAHLYGASDDTLANTLNTSLEDAKLFAREIDAEFTTAKRFGVRNLDAAKNNGFTRTLLGRIRYYPEIEERKKLNNRTINEIANAPIQGSGADMLKIALDKIDTMLEEGGYEAWPTLAIHDELVLTCRQDQAEEVMEKMTQCMEAAGAELCPDVRTPVEGHIMERWDKA